MVALGVAIVVGSFTHSSVAENLKHSPAVLAASSEAIPAEEVTALPVRNPVLISPVVKAPVAPAHVSRQMRKLMLKYDVSKIGERKVGKSLNFYSLDREMQMGREMAEEIETEMVLVNDPVISEYVNRLGQNLVRNSDAKVPFTIRVVNSSEVNAFALPGGYFYVNTGLILAADNEAELAGVMSHEIAHVAARHATHNQSKRDLVNLCTIPALFVAGPVGMALREATEAALPMEFLKFSRDAEREADLLGMQYAYAAGYDPAAMVSFFEKVEAKEKQKKGFLARAFDTHPMTAERVRRAQEEMSAMLPSKDSYMVTNSEFDDVKARLAAIENRHVIEGAPDGKPKLKKQVGGHDTADGGRPTLQRGGD
jgi:predicted Zn-dependent protease